MDSLPIISVVVFTYNSSKYIIDTLQSIYRQTYNNIELIVSDDCSTDNTVDIVDTWLSEFGGRFVKSKLIKSPFNTGVSENHNRGVKSSSGEWIKTIAGDDILEDNCVSLNFDYVCSTGELVVFSKMKYFKGTIKNAFIPNVDYSFFKFASKEQYNMMLKKNQIPCAPSFFFKRDVIKDVSYYDDRYPMMEDYPLWFKLLEKGYNLSFMDSYTVYYRRENSITRGDWFVNPVYLDSLESFYREKLFPLYKTKDLIYKWHMILYFFTCHVYINYFHNQITTKSRLFERIIKCFDLYYIRERLQSK